MIDRIKSEGVLRLEEIGVFKFTGGCSCLVNNRTTYQYPHLSALELYFPCFMIYHIHLQSIFIFYFLRGFVCFCSYFLTLERMNINVVFGWGSKRYICEL